MLELGILKTWNADTHRAGVQLVGSLTTYLDNINVAINIAPQAMVVGNYVLVAIPGGNPRDACVVASWPAGSSGGGGGGTKIQDADADTSWDVEQTADEDKVHGKVAGVEGFLMHEDGIIDLPKQSGCSVALQSAQPITNVNWTLVLLSSIAFDTQGEFTTAPSCYFTPKKAGYYLMLGVVNWYNNATGDRSVKFYKNGVNILETLAWDSPALLASYCQRTLPQIIYLAAGDHVDLRCQQVSGATVYILASMSNAFFWKVG